MLSTSAPGLTELPSIPVALTPLDVRWVPCSARFVLLGCKPNDTGALSIYALGSGGGSPGGEGGACSGGSEEGASSSLSTSLVARCERPAALKCGTFEASPRDERRLAVGDARGMLAVMDLARLDAHTYAAPSAHAGGLNAIDGCGGLTGGGSQLLVTGGRDGRVRLWDARTAQPAGEAFGEALSRGASGSVPEVWTVAFGDVSGDGRVVAAGWDDGRLALWDARAGRTLWESEPAAGGTSRPGIVSLQFDRKDIPMNKLVATGMDKRFRVYDMRTQHEHDGFASVSEKAHRSTVWTVRHLPQCRDIFSTTGGNGGINLYKYSYPASRSEQAADGSSHGVAGTLELLNARVISTQPLVALDWSADQLGLACAACLDQTVRVLVVSKLEKHI